MNAEHLLKYAIRPALKILDAYNPKMNSKAAEELLLGTAIQESALSFLRQHRDGPARGFWQIEPATADDIHNNFIDSRKSLRDILDDVLADKPDPITQLQTNLIYSCIMARLKYWRVPAAMPNSGDLNGQAAYWKKYYNTAGGKGKEEEYIAAWKRYF